MMDTSEKKQINSSIPAHQKIAIVSDAVYPFNKGGKEKRIYDITTRLVAQGYSVTIYCMKWWEGEKTIVKDGVTFHAISPYYPLYAGNRRSIKEAIIFALSCFKLFHQDFDVIEVDHMPHLVLFTMKFVCLFKRKKMIVTWHEVWGKEYWREYLGIAFGTIAYWIEKVSAKLPDLIVSISQSTTKDLRTILAVRKSIVTIQNGLDIADILSEPPATYGADIIFAGRLLAHKNVDALLRAARVLIKKKPALLSPNPAIMSIKMLKATLKAMPRAGASFFLMRNGKSRKPGVTMR